MIRFPQAWTASQRRVLIAILSLIVIFLGVQMFRHRTFVADPQPLMSSRANDLADRLDPNVATQQELAALPMLGEKRAAAIVAFRQEFIASHPQQRAFEESRDLLKVKGIGSAMLITLEPFLIFPTNPTAATTQP